MITIDRVKKVREISGCGMGECANALKWAKGDILLACGYLWSSSLAVMIYPNREDWNRSMAEEYKQRYIREKGDIG